MDLSRVYTKTSKGILDGSLKTRALGRSHARLLALIDGKSTIDDLLNAVGTRLSEARLAAILDELVSAGLIRLLTATTPEVDDLGFSSTIIVSESDTQAFFDAQVDVENDKLRQAEVQKALDESNAALLKEVTADIAAEAKALDQQMGERRAPPLISEKNQQAQLAREAAAAQAAIKQAQVATLARAEAETRAKALEAEVQARTEKAHQAEQEARKHAQSEAEIKARMLEEQKARAQAEKKAQQAVRALEAATLKAREDAEEKARLAKATAALVRRELQAKIQSEEEAQRSAEMKSRLQEVEQAKIQALAEVQTLSQALDEARIAAELETRVKRRVEARAREEADAHARLQAEAQVKLEAEAKLRAEAEAKARMEAEAKARVAAEAAAKLEAERKARIEAEDKARLEAEARVKAETEAQKLLAAEKQAAAKAKTHAEEAARREAAAEAKRQAEKAAEAKREAEQKARAAEEAQRLAALEVKKQAEADAKAKLEAERKARHEAEQQAAEAKREAEAKAKVEAARKAQIEEEKARKEAEARAKSEAERKARQEAERQTAEREKQRFAAAEAKHQAEVKAKIEAERKAQIEAEKARKEAEVRAKSEAEQARREAEAAAQVKLAAEQKAREEAQQKAQAAADAAARAQAEALAQQQAQENARRKAEEEARAIAAAEEAVRREAEAVKRQMELDQRAEEARRAQESAERALETERQARAVAESAAKSLADERAKMELAAKSREQERLRAAEKASTKARAEMDEALRRAQAEKEYEENEAARMRAEAQARAVAAARTPLPFLARRTRKPMVFDRRWYRRSALTLFALLGAAIGLAHVVPFNFYIPQLERALVQSLGQPVTIQELHFSVYPMPHLELDAIVIGDAAPTRIAKANLYPAWRSLFDDVKVMRRVELAAVSFSQGSFDALPVWGRTQARVVPLQFEHLQIKDAKISHRLLDGFSFNAEIDTRSGKFIQAQIRSTDQRITIDIAPQGIAGSAGDDALRIDLKAAGSLLPFEPRLPFDTIKISGLAQNGRLTMGSIDAQLFDGYLSGTAQVSWVKGWTLDADLALQQIELEPGLAHFTQESKLTGTLEAKVRLAAKAEALEDLFAAPQMQATFRVKNGEFSGIDLGRAIQTPSQGGKTHFNDLTGYFQTANGRYQYRQIKLQGGVVSGFGTLEVNAEQNLSGRLIGELRTPSTKLRVPFSFGGNLAAPTLKAIALAPPRVVPTVPSEAPADDATETR